MAHEFIARIDQALRIVEEWPEGAAIPRPLETALAAEVDLACDVLTDAEIQRARMPMFSCLGQVERLNIELPDGSVVSALCSWAEDHIDLAEGRYDARNWPDTRNVRTILHQWGAPGCRAFDNLEAGHNATEMITVTDDPPGPDALSLEEALAG